MNSHGRVLLVEDDELFATLVADRLQLRGFSVSHTSELAAAATLLAEGAFDVIVADLHLPDSTADVPEALRRLAADTPLVLITGSPSIDSAVRSIDRQVFAYRVKPFDLDAFAVTVGEACAHGRLQGRIAESRRRYQALDGQLDALRQARSRSGADLNQSVADYLRLLLGSCGEALAEAVEMLDSLEPGPGNRPVRELSRHPDAELFREALRETVDVLERSKNAFKSKELADLRRRLETALRLAGPATGGR